MPQFLLILLFALPVLEIFLLIKLGSLIGFFPTLFIILGTAIFGIMHIRQQGIGLINELQVKLSQGQKAIGEIVDGLGLLLGGFFFIIPGAITDFLGLSLLIPGCRRFIMKKLINYLIDRLRESEQRKL
jgi:UPF0716 protein FxsA|tara:strand:+ start:8203 stop:8589 length:387 start_codon:yes stop_codon:yes gene_type:complete